MTDDRFDRDSWERRWSQALQEHGDAVARAANGAGVDAVVRAVYEP